MNTDASLPHVSPDEILSFTRELVAVNTVNPPGNEAQAETLVLRKFKEIGLSVKTYVYGKNRKNFIGKIGNGSPSVALIGHLDTVPAGEGWETDPFTLTEKDGKLFGRGVEDNKGPLVSCWAATKAFLKTSPKFSGTLFLVAAADEETGSTFGIQSLIADGFMPEFALVPDAGGLNEAVIGEKGIFQFEVECRGKQAHGSRPDLGINAIVPLAYLALEAEKLSLNKVSSEYFTPLTVNIGVLEGGSAYNVVPACATLKIDVRYPTPLTQKNILAEVNKLVAKTRETYPHAILTLNFGHISNPHLLNLENSRFIESFERAARSFDIKMKYKTTGGNTIAKFLAEAGCQAFCHSPKRQSVAHMANEFIELDDLVLAARLYAKTLINFFNPTLSAQKPE